MLQLKFFNLVNCVIFKEGSGWKHVVDRGCIYVTEIFVFVSMINNETLPINFSRVYVIHFVPHIHKVAPILYHPSYHHHNKYKIQYLSRTSENKTKIKVTFN